MAFQKTKWATAAVAALAIGSGVPTAAFANTTPADCLDEGNVWVHVEYDETVTGACATEFGTALEATSSAGLADGAEEFVTTIDGRLASKADEEYWSLWTQEDNGEWTFAQVGAGELVPEAGTVVGWALQPDWNVNPAPAPTADPMATETQSEASDEAPAEDDSNTLMWVVVGLAALIAIVIGVVAATRKKPQAGN